MAQLIISIQTPISLGRKNLTGLEYLSLLKKQTLLNYEKIVSTKTDNDLDFFLPQTFNHMLAGITSMNQFLLGINFFLQKIDSEQKHNVIYEQQILHNIFSHHSLTQNEKFENNLSNQFNYLFNLAPTYINIEDDDLKELKKIGIIFTLVENFFRHHEAHGLTLSLIDFFRCFNIGIFPCFLLDEKYLQDFSSFSSLKDKFHFIFPEDEFNSFKLNINNLINNISDYEKKHSETILNHKFKENINEILTYSNDKIDNLDRKKMNPYLKTNFQNPYSNQNILLVRSQIVRSYLKYHSIVWNNDIIAQNTTKINEALSFNFLTENNEGLHGESISITPESLVYYFKKFLEILKIE